MASRASFAALLALPLALAAASSCGQDAATCKTICGLADAPGDCSTTCASQQACATRADFHAYLTCVANAGEYRAEIPSGLCGAEASAVTSDCAGEPSPLGTGSGSSSTSSSSTCVGPCSSSGPGASCAVLGACCSDLPNESILSCDDVASTGNEAACVSTLSMLAADGLCIGGVSSGTGTGGGSATATPGKVGSLCSVGSACEDGTQCTLGGEGPCSSDVTLGCNGGALAVTGYPCSDQVPSCGFGMGDCSESCSCSDGQMVCTGDCPDGGLSNP